MVVGVVVGVGVGVGAGFKGTHVPLGIPWNQC